MMKKPITPELDCEHLPLWSSDNDGIRSQIRSSANSIFLGKIFQFLAKINFASLRVPFTLSLANQVVSSGGNFILGIYLARSLSLAEFGYYGIGYGLCMLYIGIGNAVIVTQMSVNMSTQAAEQKPIYAAKMLNAVFVLGIVLLFVTAFSFMIICFLSPAYTKFTGKVCAVSIAAALFLCSEFFISYAYLQRKESAALLVNGTTILVLFGSLFVASRLGISPSVEGTLFYYAIGAAVGSLFAYYFSPIRVSQGVHGFTSAVLESWRHGQWALGGVAITWLQSQTYAYIALLFLGSAGVGAINAAKLFISPFSFLVPAVNKIAIPRLADLKQTNPAQMLMVSVLLTTGLTMLTIIYSLMLMSSMQLVTTLVLGRHDNNIEALIGVWCLALIFQMARAGGGVFLQVQRKFRILTLLNIPSAIITIALAFLLIEKIGAAGGVWSIVAGEAVLSLLIWREITHGKTDQH
jgi:O-antigen/teichoic acid export membrane protein